MNSSLSHASLKKRKKKQTQEHWGQDWELHDKQRERQILPGLIRELWEINVYCLSPLVYRVLSW